MFHGLRGGASAPQRPAVTGSGLGLLEAGHGGNGIRGFSQGRSGLLAREGRMWVSSQSAQSLGSSDSRVTACSRRVALEGFAPCWFGLMPRHQRLVTSPSGLIAPVVDRVAVLSRASFRYCYHALATSRGCTGRRSLGADVAVMSAVFPSSLWAVDLQRRLFHLRVRGAKPGVSVPGDRPPDVVGSRAGGFGATGFALGCGFRVALGHL